MRFVQVTESTSSARMSFGPFRLIRLNGYAPAQGEIYFFSVQTHPIDPDILLALFPMVHAFCGCIAIAFSTDGVRWTAPFPLLRADVIGDRTVDHPVAGLVRRGQADIPVLAQECAKHRGGQRNRFRHIVAHAPV